MGKQEHGVDRHEILVRKTCFVVGSDSATANVPFILQY